MSAQGASVGDLQAAAQELLMRRGREWYADLPAAARPVLVSAQQRPRCTLLRYRLSAHDVQHEVLVKGRREEPADAPVLRPRLALASQEGVEELAQREHQGLRAIVDAVSDAGDERLGAVRPLGLLPGHAALAMDFLPAPTLRDLLLQSAVRGRRVPDAVWRNAGRWLALFQQGGEGAELPARLATRDEVAEMFSRLAEHLGLHTGDRSLADTLADAGARAAATLPERLPLARVHHDFVARNVLVGPGSRVTVIDPMMSARAPVHEDVGRFLVGLRANGFQLASRGMLVRRSHVEDYERAFLDGYAELGGDVGAALPVTYALVLLDRWAAHVTPAAGPRGRRAELVARWSGVDLRAQALRLLRPYA